MLVSGSTVSELPISSSREMLFRSNGEIIRVTLYRESEVEITLSIQQAPELDLNLE